MTTRRTLIKAATVAAGTAAVNFPTGFPTIWAQNIRNVTLRQFGTGRVGAESDRGQGEAGSGDHAGR